MNILYKRLAEIKDVKTKLINKEKRRISTIPISKKFSIDVFTTDYKRLETLTSGVYVLIFPNDKKYVGYLNDVEQSLCNRSFPFNSKMRNDYPNIGKYEENDFFNQCDIIVYPYATELLSEKVDEIIKDLDSINNGYNSMQKYGKDKVYTQQDLENIKSKNEERRQKRYNMTNAKENVNLA